MKFFSAWLIALPFAAQSASSDVPVTFNRQIAPIIYQNCSSCHRPGEAAPFALLSYNDVAKKAKTIARVTAGRQMPPWKAEPASYAYRDERRLTGEQIELIQKWVDDGMPEGRAVVHHVLYFADGNGRIHEKPQQGDQPGFSGMRAGGASIPLGGWAVGAQPHFFPDGLALKVPKGSDLVVQYHFHPTGKPEAEKSVIGLYFAKQPPTRTMTRIQMPPHYSLFSGLDIPAGEKDFVIRDSYTLPVAVDGVGMSAHAHYIAKQLKMTATLPDGEVKTLLWIKDWDFAWQDKYFFKELEPLPAGTRLDAEIHWDNSADNPNNPVNPPVRVEWGEETKNEMGSISLIAVPHDESDLATLREDISQREKKLVHEKMRSDPALARKVMQILGE